MLPTEKRTHVYSWYGHCWAGAHGASGAGQVPQRSQHGLPVAPSLRQASPLPRSGWVLRKDRRKMQHVQTFPFMMSCCNAMCWALCKHCNNFYHVLIMCWVLCTTFTARLRLIYDVMFKLTLFLFVGTQSLQFPKLTDTISLRFELLVLKAIQGQTQMNHLPQRLPPQPQSSQRSTAPVPNNGAADLTYRGLFAGMHSVNA